MKFNNIRVVLLMTKSNLKSLFRESKLWFTWGPLAYFAGAVAIAFLVNTDSYTGAPENPGRILLLLVVWRSVYEPINSALTSSDWQSDLGIELGTPGWTFPLARGLADAFYQSCLMLAGLAAFVVFNNSGVKIGILFWVALIILLFGIAHYFLASLLLARMAQTFPWIKRLGVALLTIGFYSVPILWDYESLRNEFLASLIQINPYFYIFQLVLDLLAGGDFLPSLVGTGIFLAILGSLHFLASNSRKQIGNLSRGTTVVATCLTLQNSNKYPILGPFNFSALPGKITGVIGRNGVGKSSLLRAMVGLPNIRGGQLKVVERNSVGALLDNSPQLVSWNMTAAEELELRLLATGADPQNLNETLEEIFKNLRELGISTEMEMHKLSSGQRFLARFEVYSVSKPKMLISDEWFSTLDERLADHFRKGLHGLASSGSLIVLAGTPNSSIGSYADEIVTIDTQ